VTISLEGLLVVLLIGGVAGWLAGVVMRGRGLGVVGNIVVGIVGALLAAWLLPKLGLVIAGGLAATFINAVIGAVILLALVGLIKRA
jgi:uncharacterized membrane protein YeaQ/YmgE (transglycosylase-associated protein family)